MNELLITKQGLGQQDIIFGKGDIAQERNGELYNISKVSIIYPCSSVEELKELDTEKFVTALVYADDNSNLYRFDVNSQEAESLPDVIESNTTNLGRWVMIELGLKGDFVTRNTPQTVLIGADKVWENNNTFSGNSEFGQFTIKPTLDANVLKFTFLDVAGAERSSIGYTKVDDINLTFENKIESGEFDFNSSLNIVAENNQNIQFCTPVQDNDPNVLTTIGYKADDLTFFVFESNDGTTFKFNQQISMSDKKIVDVATCTDALDAANKQYVDDQDNLLSDKIAVNAQNIATNTQNIATNTTNIATNAQNIVDTNTRVDNLEDFMNQHLGASVIIGQIQKTKDEVEVDRTTILDDFVQQQKSRQPKEGDSIYTTDNYAYYYSDSWSNPYTISINVATSTTAGLVLSSEDVAGNKGRVAVNPLDGVMSVLGWNDVYDVATDPNLAYLNKVQIFTENQAFDSSVYVGTARRDRSLSVRGNIFATGTTSAGLNLFAGAGGYSQNYPEDSIFTVCTGSGNPSRLNNRVCYNKDLTQGDVTDYEVVNNKWMTDYVDNATGKVIPSNIYPIQRECSIPLFKSPDSPNGRIVIEFLDYASYVIYAATIEFLPYSQFTDFRISNVWAKPEVKTAPLSTVAPIYYPGAYIDCDGTQFCISIIDPSTQSSSTQIRYLRVWYYDSIQPKNYIEENLRLSKPYAIREGGGTYIKELGFLKNNYRQDGIFNGECLEYYLFQNGCIRWTSAMTLDSNHFHQWANGGFGSLNIDASDKVLCNVGTTTGQSLGVIANASLPNIKGQTGSYYSRNSSKYNSFIFTGDNASGMGVSGALEPLQLKDWSGAFSPKLLVMNDNLGAYIPWFSNTPTIPPSDKKTFSLYLDASKSSSIYQDNAKVNMERIPNFLVVQAF